ncbi:MAG: cysteine--tRNA ligase [Clostridiales bacterium]|nr:cysteine--tRNA ligase [Clostridiales bacterium]
MKLYNTLTRQVEEFIPHDKNNVTMYTCGPTVYHYAHIGNLRSYIMEDVLEKSLNFVGYKVKRAMNITDVGHLSSDGDTGDDKMLKGAKRENKTVLEIAKFYTDAFKKDCEKLNIKWPEIVVPATTCIDEYISIIKTLLNKNYAYISNGNIYFDVSKLKEYYVLTNQKNDMIVGAREDVEEDKDKKNPADFVLWFTKSKFDDQELKWESPWGLGYPGWHIECTGISIKTLGEYLDIHCGGIDNKFPHHTNEIAQSEGYLGHSWCKYWFHVEHLNTTTGKMSKSKGEFLTVSLLEEKGYDPMVYRLFCLQSHYRKQLVFSFDSLDMAKSAYNKLINKVRSIENVGDIEIEKSEEYIIQFKKALENDINTSLALTSVYDVLKADINGATKLYLLEKFDTVLGLNLLKNKVSENKTEENSDIPQNVKELAEERKIAKQNKDYNKADILRNEITSLGYIIKDTKDGYEIIKGA